jgi:hypothetical protein
METINVVATDSSTECRSHSQRLVCPAMRLRLDVTIRVTQSETLEKAIQLISGDFSFTQWCSEIVSNAHDLTGEVV